MFDAPLYLDTETNGLTWPSLAKVVAVKDTSFNGYFYSKLDTPQECRKLERILKQRTVIGWNVGFDMAMLRAAGVDVSVAALWVDGCELSRLRHSDWLTHGLKDLARRFKLDTSDEDEVHADVATFLEGRLTKSNIACNMWRSSKVWEYCRRDVERTQFMVERLRLLPTQGEDFYKVDSQVMVWAANRYVKGVRLDPNIVEQVYDLYVDRINETIDEANAMGVPVNSPKALVEFFYLQAPEAGIKSTNVETLEELAAHEKLSAYADLTLRFRKARTRLGLMNKMYEATKTDDCRIHPMFAITTKTGRLTCRAPNMQQWPRPVKGELGIRDCMIADEGHKLVNFDYSQQELRICCALLGTKPLLTMIASDDPHSYMANYLVNGDDAIKALLDAAKENNVATTRSEAAQAYSDAGNDVVKAEQKLFGTKLVRTMTKTIVFSQLYGAGLRKVAMQLKQPVAVVANKYYGFQKLLATYQPRPNIQCYYGTNLTCDSPHKALNRYGQGTGAEISKRTICKIIESGIDLLATTHDDFKAQVPISDTRSGAELFSPIVSQFVVNGVRMESDYD